MDKHQPSLTESLITQHNESSDDQANDISEFRRKHLAKLKPVNGTSILQNLFFTWISPLLAYGSKQNVTVDAMPTLPPNLTTSYEYNRISNEFTDTVKSSAEGWTLSKAIIKTFYKQFLIILAILLFVVAIYMFSPYLTAMIMDYIQDRSSYQFSYGIILFVVTLVSTFLKSIFQTQMMYKFTQLGINMTNSLTMMIYCKSLKYASIAQKQFGQSDIINYSQVDAQRMTYMGFQLAALFVAPVQIVVGIIIMYTFIGVSFVSGIGMMLLMIGCTFFLAKRSIRYNQNVLKAKDERMKVTQQMLDIIRYIKISAIQKFFFGKLDQKRMKEIELYKKKGLMDVITIFVYWLACPMILSATFFTYIQLGNQMSSEVAFTTIMIFTTLQYPIRLVPTAISELIQIYSSIKRIQKYLLTEEINLNDIHFVEDQDCDFAVKIQRGNFYWGVEIQKEKEEEKETNKKDKQKNKEKKDKQNKKQKDKDKTAKHQISVQQSQQQFSLNRAEKIETQSQTESQVQFTLKSIKQRNPKQNANQQNKQKYIRSLKDINTTIQKDKFTILVGDIGSGKSSLLLAILNQMRNGEGSSIQVNGSIAYACQKPWILSSTVKQNITFSMPFNQVKFQKVIHYASLAQDLKILPKGVQTEIGEKGVNLSGGQKARISLARALYSQKDIYLLDDILSAVDVHVGDFLMKETLLGYLKGKTIIMPTHAIKYAEAVDQIVVMKKGRIVRKGHYQDIKHTPQFQEISMKEKNKQNKGQGDGEAEKKIESQLAMLRQVMKNRSEDKREQLVAVSDKLVEEMLLPQDHKIGKVDFNIFKEYIDLNGGLYRFALLVTTAMFLWIVFTTSASIVMERWCEDPIGQSYDLYIYIALSVLSNVFIFIRAYTLILSGAKQGERVHKSMIKSLLYASLGKFYNRVPIGRIVNRLTKDLRELDESVGFAIGNLLVCIFSLLGTLTICIYGSTPLVLIPMVIVAYFSHKVRAYYMKTQRQVSRYEKSTNSPIVSGFMSSISGLSTIRAYQKQGDFINRQIIFIDNNKRVRLNKAALESWFSISLTYLSFLVNMAAIGYCILSTNDNPSLAGLLMNYALNLSSDIIGFTLSFAYFQTKIISLERIYNFMKIEPEQAYSQYCLNWQPEQEGYNKIITRGQLQFTNLCARYRTDLPNALRGLTCKIQGGQKVGIVGRTGAGKTTIINTILRITEITEGAMLIDGRNILEIALKDLRNGITMIDQEPTLIKSTFRQNLDITGSYSDEQLYSILQECNLYETIKQKGGLDGSVSNNSLSAGEKQLLCICRAFLKHSSIVLIDEATANIDMKNDGIIQRVIADKFKKCTVLTIAHRLSTLKNSDIIVVLQNGKIIQYGSPAQLEGKSEGIYKSMVLKNANQFLT